MIRWPRVRRTGRRHGLAPRSPHAAALALVAFAACPGALVAQPELPTPESIPAVDAVVVVADFGEFRVRLDRAGAPNHVAHFLTMAGTGHYSGLSFHRVIPDLLIQAGDPATREKPPEDSPDSTAEDSGAGSLPYALPEEATERTHVRGTLSMAWRGDRPGTAASQWFVALLDSPQLDGWGTPIGEVIAGMEIVDRIAQVPTRANRDPLRRVVISEIRLEEAGDETVPWASSAVPRGR